MFSKIIKSILSFFYSRKVPYKATFTYFYQLKHERLSFFIGFKPVLYLLATIPFLNNYFFRLESSERIVELPFVLNNILSSKVKNLKILEIGCTESVLSMQLSSFGAKVTGIDLRLYPLTHPNFNFKKGDFLKLKMRESCFDFVILISVIEHIGLQEYGESYFVQNKDILTIKKIKKILKPKGKLIISFPYGKGGIGKWRVYNQEKAKLLLNGFDIEKEEYFLRKNKKFWIEVNKEKLNNVKSFNRTNGVAIFLLKKVF